MTKEIKENEDIIKISSRLANNLAAATNGRITIEISEQGIKLNAKKKYQKSLKRVMKMMDCMVNKKTITDKVISEFNIGLQELGIQSMAKREGTKIEFPSKTKEDNEKLTSLFNIIIDLP